MTKKHGFTLAEVLITLGIIGVVAAMTIPTLIANTNSSKFRSQFKKSISTLNQAGLMAQAQYDIDYGATNKACGTTEGKTADQENPDSTLSFCAIFNGTLSGQSYLGAPTTLKTKGDEAYSWEVSTLGSVGDYLAYSLADGSIIGFNKDAKGCILPVGVPLNSDALKAAEGEGEGATPAGRLRDCIGFIDVNGATLPNKEVKCSSGDTSLTPETPCVVGSDANHMTDIYPIVFHDATVEPASNAAKYVLTTSK